MAEIKFNNLYDQLGLLDQKFYDSTFKDTYDPTKEQPMLEMKPAYDQMKAVYEAEQQVPKKSFLDSINFFSEASAAMPDNPYGIVNTDIVSQMYTPRQQEIIFGDPNYLGTNNTQYYEGTKVPVANVGELLMDAGTTNFMDQFKTEPAVPAMSIEDQIQANIDRIQSTPGFEGYVPSGTPTPVNKPNMRDVAGDIDLNLTDLGNPYNDPRVVSEEQGLSGFPGTGQVDPGFQNVLDAREARAAQIANQQNPDYGQFFKSPAVNEKKNNLFNDLLGLAALAYSGPHKGALKTAAMLNNWRTGKLNRVLNTAAGIPSAVNKKFRGVNPVTNRANTQAQWEQQREERRQQKRTDDMIDRITKGKRTRSNPRDAGTTKAQKDAISAAIQDAARTRQYDKGGNQGSGGQSKIVCTMMNERYGFGSFRNKIWMKFHENHGPEYQKGYHTIFLPLVKIAKGEGKLNTAVRKVLEHMGRHVTADMFKIMKGKKRDTLGRLYRAIFEPTCHIIGKIKSALGRG